MTKLTVLEFVRDPEKVWVLPAAPLAALRRAFPEVAIVSPADVEAADAQLPHADIVFGYAVRPDNFTSAARLRWIQISSAGVGAALFPALVESPVVLTNGRGLFSDAMAEHALGMMLSFARKLHLARDLQHARRWAHIELRDTAPELGTLAGTTLGIVGFGSIGEALAVRARAFGMRIIATRRAPQTHPMPADEQWESSRLNELLECSDWIVLTPPLTPQTRGMIGAGEMARMRPGAVIVNLGRGALIDEAALIEALRSGRVAGAALDVFSEEPLPETSLLWTLPNVIVSPHVSGLGPGLWERAVDMFSRNLRAFIDGRPLENVVDKRAGY